MLPKASDSALIVVDMQNSFFKGGACDQIGLPVERMEAAIDPCTRLIAAARGASVPVIFTRYVYRADYRDGGIMVELIPALRTSKALVAGTPDAEIIPALQPAKGDFVLDKNRPSAFYGTPLETWLNGLGVKEVVVCGITTNCCVETTVRDASQRDYRPFIVQDAVAEWDDARHNAALQSMAMLFAHATDVASIEKAWGSAA